MATPKRAIAPSAAEEVKKTAKKTTEKKVETKSEEIKKELKTLPDEIQKKTEIRSAHVPFLEDERNFVIIER